MKLTEKMLRILERSMDATTAFKILGLEYGDYAGVDKAYKKLAMLNHPDRGGDMEKMKDINQAKDAVGGKKGSATPRQSHDDWRRERDEYNAKQKKRTEDLLATFISKVKPAIETYTGYFENVTGKRHTVKFKETANTHYSQLTAKFISDDKETSFNMEFTLRPRSSSGALSGPESKELEADYEASMLLGAKKFKMTVKRWNVISFNASDFADPSKVFPQAKIKKNMAASGSKPIKRADVIEFLKTNFDARFNSDRTNDWCYIPLNGAWGKAEFALVILRYGGSWGLRGLGGLVGTAPNQHYNMGSKNAIRSQFFFMPETRAFVNALKDIVKIAEKCAKTKNLSELNKYMEENSKSWYENK
jgi:curved DNA-binding protein CbpA